MCFFHLLYTYLWINDSKPKAKGKESWSESLIFLGWTHKIDSDVFTHKNSIIIAWIAWLISMKTEWCIIQFS